LNSEETAHTLLEGMLEGRFGSQMKRDEKLAKFTSARIGGPADIVVETRSLEDLIDAADILWGSNTRFRVLGGGSNVLVSDAGYRGVVLINRAKKFSYEERNEHVLLHAESGAFLGFIARHASETGFSGLEWAAGIPGTIGGAVIGNAGAHGSSMAENIFLVNILHHSGETDAKTRREQWPLDRCAFTYRSSFFKRHPGRYLVLEVVFRLLRGGKDEIQSRLKEFSAFRHATQPQGASMGSMFKNPEGDYAGRLIDKAGLKGYRIGEAQISEKHANFFINLGEARSEHVVELLKVTHERVMENFGVDLKPEIEFIGEQELPF
jgi:UDP-N-acetylmuramate dehydrogenase